MWIQLLFPIILVAAALLLIRGVVIGRRSGGAEGRSGPERIALWLAFCFAVVASLLLLVLPTYSGLSTTEVVAGGVSVSTSSRGTLLQTEGFWAVVVLSVPLALTTAGLATRASTERRAVIRTGAALLTVFVLLASFTVGWAYLPSALALWVAVFLAQRPAAPANGAIQK